MRSGALRALGHGFGRRTAMAAAMGLWSLVFAWLWLGGEMTRYLGPRTYWVAPFGALALGGAAAVTAAGARRAGNGTGPSASDAARFGVLLLPLAAVVAVPGAQLGSHAAANKTQTGILAGVAAAAPASGPIGFRDIYYRGLSERYALERGIGDGMGVKLTGFVTHPAGIPGRLLRVDPVLRVLLCSRCDSLLGNRPSTGIRRPERLSR